MPVVEHFQAEDASPRLLARALSAQIWIPVEGRPIIEGIYVQLLRDEFCEFVGSRPAKLPRKVSSRIAKRSWLPARLFQRLGYVGRCSFDLIATDTGQLKFVECNGRWGGTSMPMTLMNRLLGDYYRRPYLSKAVDMDGLKQTEFSGLLTHFTDDLFDVRTGRGRLVFFNPGRIGARSGVEVIALEETMQAASELSERELPQRLAKLIDSNRNRNRTVAH